MAFRFRLRFSRFKVQKKKILWYLVSWLVLTVKVVKFSCIVRSVQLNSSFAASLTLILSC